MPEHKQTAAERLAATLETNPHITAQARTIVGGLELVWEDPPEEEIALSTTGMPGWMTLKVGARFKPMAYVRRMDDGRWRALMADNGSFTDSEENAKSWCEYQVRRLLAETLSPMPIVGAV